MRGQPYLERSRNHIFSISQQVGHSATWIFTENVHAKWRVHRGAIYQTPHRKKPSTCISWLVNDPVARTHLFLKAYFLVTLMDTYAVIFHVKYSRRTKYMRNLITFTTGDNWKLNEFHSFVHHFNRSNFVTSHCKYGIPFLF